MVRPAAEQLQQQVSGNVLAREDPGYDQIRRGWDLTVDHYPALILVPRDATDIAAGVRFAHESGLDVAVQCTGHGMLYPADDNLLIVTSRMASVLVNAEACTAWVEAGVTWQQVLDAATPHGLAPLLGSSPNVGVVGYMLGGGIGWLGRRYGFGADSLRWIDIVTADGVLRRTSPSENSDLFWGFAAEAAISGSSRRWSSISIGSRSSTAAVWSIRRKSQGKRCASTGIGSERCPTN